ncbi:Nuclear transport factor 2 [Aspergillus nanangensis]|uniref:Nuclear transport factor 2 n=1 Tax=Aspergillus nanangensis TaxID=2582783 RepID=A0AAD4CNX7_ASPNN|nr:Nuclear transport factor 2 [Aspergillus nanangensis]
MAGEYPLRPCFFPLFPPTHVAWLPLLGYSAPLRDTAPAKRSSLHFQGIAQQNSKYTNAQTNKINLPVEQFVQFYYQTFDGNRQNLAGLYRDHSMLTFETNSVQGTANIVEKLASLPFQKVAHQVSTLDAQPSNQEGGILVMVTGALLVDEEQKPMNYTQSFQLLPDGQGSYFVFNDIFRLVYG